MLLMQAAKEVCQSDLVHLVDFTISVLSDLSWNFTVNSVTYCEWNISCSPNCARWVSKCTVWSAQHRIITALPIPPLSRCSCTIAALSCHSWTFHLQHAEIKRNSHLAGDSIFRSMFTYFYVLKNGNDKMTLCPGQLEILYKLFAYRPCGFSPSFSLATNRHALHFTLLSSLLLSVVNSRMEVFLKSYVSTLKYREFVVILQQIETKKRLGLDRHSLLLLFWCPS